MLSWVFNNGYNLLLALGGVSVIVLMILRRSMYKLTTWQAVLLSLALLACAVAGAKLLYIIESGGKTDGMSLFGAVFLVLLCMPMIGRLFSLTGKQTLDACSPCGASVIGFVRFGCYLADCCGGRYVNLGSLFFRWPTQIMESFCDFCILALLLQMEKKSHRTGELYAWFLILYCLCRFAIEFLRDTSREWLGLSHGHCFSIIGFMMGLIVFLYMRYQKEKTYEKNKKNKR